MTRALSRNESLDNLSRLKYRSFLVVFALGALAMTVQALLAFFDAEHTGADPSFLTFLGLVYAGLVVAMLHSRRFAPLYAHLGYVVLVFAFMTEYYLALRGSVVQLTEIMPWLSVVLAATFLVYGRSNAMVLATGLYLVLLGFAVWRVLVDPHDVPPLALGRSLADLFLANAIMIVFLAVFTRLFGSYGKLRSLAEAMTELALTDDLTGLANRRAVQDRLETEVAKAVRYRRGFALILFDLDGFKRVNDRFGLEVGDVVLRQVAARALALVRQSDQLGRWGGEEFMVIAAEPSLTCAQRLAERLQEGLGAAPFGRAGTLTASFGVTVYSEGDTPETLLRRVDSALYEAKTKGNNRIEAVA